MALKRRQFSREFKLQVIHEVEAGKAIAQAAREYQLHLIAAERPDRLPLVQMCRVLSLSRVGYYRRAAEPRDGEAHLELRDTIQRIVLEMPAYGYRRVAHELHRRGYPVNHKRVLRLMHQDNLLCLRKRSWVRTTDSQHGLAVSPKMSLRFMVYLRV